MFRITWFLNCFHHLVETRALHFRNGLCFLPEVGRSGGTYSSVWQTELLSITGWLVSANDLYICTRIKFCQWGIVENNQVTCSLEQRPYGEAKGSKVEENLKLILSDLCKTSSAFVEYLTDACCPVIKNRAVYHTHLIHSHAEWNTPVSEWSECEWSPET